MVPSSSSSSLSQQRNQISQQQHSTLSSHHLAPHSTSPSYASSYASSISSLPGSRPSSPAPMSTGVTINMPSPPQSPTAFQLKTFVSSAPSTPPVSTVVSVGTPSNLTPSSASSSYFPPIPPPPVPAVSLFSLLTQPVTRTVLALTIIMTLFSLGGSFPENCTAPSHILHSGEYLSLLASPFVIPLKPSLLASAKTTLLPSIFLAMSNILSLGLYEEHLTAIFYGDGSRIFRNMFVVLVGFVMALRQVMGFVFSRATGWALPLLFFSDSMFECNLGLAPYLFSLLVIQSPFPVSNAKAASLWNLRRTHIQVVLCLLNILPKTILWWALSGMVVGLIVLGTVLYQHRQGHWGSKIKASAIDKEAWDEEILDAMLEDDDAFTDADMVDEPISFRTRRSNGSFWRLLIHALPSVLVVLLALFGGNWIHTFQPDVPNAVLNKSVEPRTPYLLTLLMLTAPRKNGVTYIKETLNSYLNNFPDEEVDPLYSRIQIVVYTHFTDFAGYDQAKAYFDTIPKARKFVKWVREDGSEKNHRLHLLSAIRKVGTSEDSVYMGIMEDDFPFCVGGWQEMLNTIYEANRQVEEHCGVFVGTGGSGLIMKRSVALTASFILENDLQTDALGLKTPPPDITLQNCMLGNHDFCSSCSGTLVTSKTLLQKHLGFDTSSSSEGYDKNEFQCGWRQPFNGRPNVHTL